MFNTELAIRKTISEISQHRDNAIQHLRNINRSMELYIEECKQIGQYVGNNRHLSIDLERAIKDVDRRSWRTAFSMTGISAYMDAKARNDFDHELENNPPEFTRDNIQSILLSAMQESEMMFKRGVVEIFKKLNGDYKRHDAFKLNKKLICSHWFVRCRVFNCIDVNYRADDEITDLERALLLLDGKKYTNPSLCYKIKESLRESLVFEDDYIKIRAYKNGNAHINIKREDLVDKINEIISDWYGSSAVASR